MGLLKSTGITTLPIMHRTGLDPATISFSNLATLLAKVNFDKEAYLNANVCVAASFTDMLFVEADATIKDTMLLMERNRLYEVALVRPDTRDIQHIVSQSDVVRFIYENREVLLKDSHVSLALLGSLGSSNVGTMSELAPVKDACKMLARQGVNAIALVDQKGAMHACLTPSSFAELSSQHWIDFSDPIKKFKVEGRDEGWVLASETLEGILRRVVAHNIHRVWVLNDAGTPVRIITLSDIIHHVISIHKIH